MSVIVTVGAVGAVLVNTGVLAGMATAVASAMGLRAIEAAGAADAAEAARAAGLTAELEGAAATHSAVEITSAAADALKTVVAERCVMRFEDDQMTLTVERDIRGTLSVRAHSETVSKAELGRRAQALLGGIQQQVAYRQALRTLKQRGFVVESEERLADGTARVRVVKSG